MLSPPRPLRPNIFVLVRPLHKLPGMGRMHAESFQSGSISGSRVGRGRNGPFSAGPGRGGWAGGIPTGDIAPMSLSGAYLDWNVIGSLVQDFACDPEPFPRVLGRHRQ